MSKVANSVDWRVEKIGAVIICVLGLGIQFFYRYGSYPNVWDGGYLFGTLMLCLGLSIYARSKGRSAWWGICGLSSQAVFFFSGALITLGMFLVLRDRRKSPVDNNTEKSPPKIAVNVFGVLVKIVLFIVIGGYLLMMSAGSLARHMRRQQEQAIKNLGREYRRDSGSFKEPKQLSTTDIQQMLDSTIEGIQQNKPSETMPEEQGEPVTGGAVRRYKRYKPSTSTKSMDELLEEFKKIKKDNSKEAAPR